MKCVYPPELNEAELLTYVDGEAGAQVTAHIERCPYCREKAQALGEWQGRLTKRLYRLGCPPPADLGEYQLGMLTRTHTEKIERHLAECPHCTRELAQLKTYLADLASDVEFGPLERVKVLVARLIRGRWGGDSSNRLDLAPAFAGIRGETDGPLVFQVGDIQIAIEVQDDVDQPGHKVVLGLVTGLDAHGFATQVWQAERLIAETSIDEAGNFVLPHLTPGRYEWILSGPETEIHIQTLTV